MKLKEQCLYETKECIWSNTSFLSIGSKNQEIPKFLFQWHIYVQIIKISIGFIHTVLYAM